MRGSSCKTDGRDIHVCLSHVSTVVELPRVFPQVVGGIPHSIISQSKVTTRIASKNKYRAVITIHIQHRPAFDIVRSIGRSIGRSPHTNASRQMINDVMDIWEIELPILRKLIEDY